MLKIDLDAHTGTIACFNTAFGAVWYCICGRCGHMDEIAPPHDPDAEKALCQACRTETGYEQQAAREAAQREHDYRRDVLP